MAIDITRIGIELDTSGLERGIRHLNAAEQAANRAADAASNIGGRGAGGLRRYGEEAATAERQTRALSDTTATFGRLMNTVFAGLGAGALISQIDAYTKYTAQLKLASTGAAEFAASMDSVRRIASTAQADLASVGTLYARIAASTKEMGLSQEKVAAITETVGLSLKVSGASAGEAASAMLQLSQSFAAGRLNGQEFAAVAEAAPGLLQILAESMGKTRGELKALSEAGQLTTDVMAKAFSDPAIIANLQQQATQVQTIGGAFTVLKNNIMEFTGVQAQASGAVSALTTGIGLLANNLGVLAGATLTLAAVKLATWMEAQIAATYAQVMANRALLASNLEAAKAAATAAGVESVLATARLAEVRASVLAAEGNVALAITTNGLIPAQARATIAAEAHSASLLALSVAQKAASASSALVGGALALLGGPIGAIVTVLGLGATAWYMWGKSSEDASKQAAGAIEATHFEIMEALEKQNEKLRQRIALAKAGNVEAAKEGGANAEKLASTLKEINKLKAKGAELDGADQIVLIELERRHRNLSDEMGVNRSLLGELASLGSQSKAETWMAKYATDAEKMAAELKQARSELSAAPDKLAEVERRITAQYEAKAKGSGAAASAVAKEQSTYQKLIASITDKIKQNEAELASGDKLNAAAKMRVQLDAATEQGARKLTAAHKAQAEALLQQLDLTERQLALSAAQKKFEESRDRENEAIADGIQKLQEQAQALEDEAEAYGKTAGELQALAIARKQAKIADLEYFDGAQDRINQLHDEVAALQNVGAAREVLAGKKLTDATDETLRNAQEMARLYQSELSTAGLTATQRKLIADQRKIALDYAKKEAEIDKSGASEAVKESSRRTLEAAKQSELQQAAVEAQDTAWASMWESVDKTAHDVFVNVANDGMGAFKRIGQTLKSAVLDMLYQMTIKKWIVSIGASVGGMGGMAQAASATASTLGAAGDAASVYSAGSALAGLGAFGGAVSGFGTAALSAAQTMVGMTGTVAQMTTSLAAAGHTAASGLAAGVQAFQAIPGWGWALAGVALLAGSGLGKTRGANHGGGIYSSAGLSNQDAAQSIAGNLGWEDPVTDFTTRGNDALSGQVKAAVDSLLEVYAGLGALAKGAVTDLEVVAGFATNSKHDDEDVYGYFKIFDKMTGDLLSAYSNREMGKDADAAWAQYVADLGSAMVSQLLEADIPSWMATVLNELGEAPTMDALTGAVAKIHTIDAAFGAFSATIDGFAGLTDKAREALMQAFGGIEGLSTSMTAYYEAYYSEAERAAKSTEALRLEFAKAGKELPATKEAYRAMVESALDGGEATAGFAAALIRLAPAFDSAKSAMTSLQAETKNLQIELMRASGDIAGAAAAQRALDTSGFDSATLAAYDLNESLREQIKTAEDAKAAREKAAAEEQNLQRTLKTLLGDTVWLREQELSTLNASNRGLQERIWALEDAKAAEAAARNNIEAAFSMLEKSVAAEKKAISDRLAAQEAGHQAQIDAAQEASSAIQSIASALANAVKSVRIETDRFDWRRLLAARSTISSATTAADLSQVVGLEDALGVAGQDNKKFYGRFEDYAFDQGVMAGNINLLDEKARLQLSTSDQMLLTLKDQLNAAKEAANAEMAALDAQLEEQRHLANVALGIDDSVLSVADAIAALGAAINGLAAAQAQVAIAQAQASAAAASMSGGGGGGGGGGTDNTSYVSKEYSDADLKALGFDPAEIRRGFQHAQGGGSAFARGGMDSYIKQIIRDGNWALNAALGGGGGHSNTDKISGFTDLQRVAAAEAYTNKDGNGLSAAELQTIQGMTTANKPVYSSSAAITNFEGNRDYGQSEISNAINTVLGQGASIADIISSGATSYGLSEQQVREAARSAGIPGFSQGINVVPHDMLAQIHEGEAVVPAHFNPFNPRAANSANNDELVAELRALRAEVADLKASNSAIAGHTAATHRQLVRIAPNDRVQTEVAA